MISYIGANKHHRQRKFVRRSTKRSVVQSTCKMSRGWMMRRELRCEGLVGRALRAMARSIEGTRSFYGFKLLVLYAGSHLLVPVADSICFALGNKSGSFCEAVNCEQVSKRGSFFLRFDGSHLLAFICWFRGGGGVNCIL